MTLSGKARQVLATLCVNLLACSLGTLMGWVSEGEEKNSLVASNAIDMKHLFFFLQQGIEWNEVLGIGGIGSNDGTIEQST